MERLVLIPVELVAVGKAVFIILPCFFLAGGLAGSNGFWAGAMSTGLFAAVAWLLAIVAGAVLTPLLLPWLPGRAFSLKGAIVGLSVAVADSARELIDEVDFVTEHDGGEGAVREILECYFEAIGKSAREYVV